MDAVGEFYFTDEPPHNHDWFVYLPRRKHYLEASLTLQVLVTRSFLRTYEKYSWFELEERTKSILQALISIDQKLPYRLKHREDLPAVLSILES